MKVNTSWPDLTRADAAAVIVSEIIVGTLERQQNMVNAFQATWENAACPDGMIAGSLFASTDGERMLMYGQWASEEAFLEFDRAQRASRARQVSAAVPGVERRPPVSYRLYRSSVRPQAASPGCLVAVSVEFDGPDEPRQKQWVDMVFEALAAEPELPQGGISGHFHLSTDGRRVLNYAEWSSEAAHREALERSGQGTIGRGPKWRAIQNFPGLISSYVRRYTLAASLGDTVHGAEGADQ